MASESVKKRMRPNDHFYIFSVIFLGILLGGCEKKTIPLISHPGAQIFHAMKRTDVRCYRCHGDRGEGTHRGPSLVRGGKTIPDDLFISTVLDGRGNMPPFRSVLAEEDIRQIIDWLGQIPP